MPAYRYESINAAGKKENGVIEADSPRAARQMLRDRALIPVTLHPAFDKSNAATGKKAGKSQRLRPKERVLLTRQLATLLAAGLPVGDAIMAAAEQCERPATRALILALRSKVTEGHTFAAALRHFPAAFSELYCATVAAGEKTGHLDTVLQRLADYTERQFTMRQKITHALIYPAIMILVATGITGFLLEFVVPRMISVYGDTGQPLPFLTQCLMALSHGIATGGLPTLILIIAGTMAFRWSIRRHADFRLSVHHLLLKLPLFGWGIRTANTARFSRTFAILSSAGVSVLEAMRIASSLVTSLPIRSALSHSVQRVKEGTNIHQALRQSRYFSPMTIHMIASGEAGGQLENMLSRAAENEENELTRMIDTGLALSEPLIILIMGAIVLFIVLAVLLPVFQLDQLNM